MMLRLRLSLLCAGLLCVGLLCIGGVLISGLTVSTFQAVRSALFPNEFRVERNDADQLDDTSPANSLREADGLIAEQSTTMDSFRDQNVLIAEQSTTMNSPAIRQIVQPGDGFFQNPIAIPDFPEGVDWINTNSKLQLSDLKGKLVLLDFWTYCCINCMHILPTLDAIEKKYEKQLVVIGVHTAKFEAEKETESIREAIQRYEIRHPVLNDGDHILWKRLQIGSWPTLVLLDPQGRAIWANAGEIDFADLDRVMQRAVNYYQRRNEIDTRSVHFALEALSADATPLKYPGKALADAATNRVYIADSNHNRILVTDLDGKLLHTIGRGTEGATDGDFATAEFNHPQGVAVKGELLFVADTENHRIRVVDLQSRRVKTIAGTGTQTHSAWFGANANTNLTKRLTREPLKADLASPWDVLVHEDTLFIAMAGTHQIWTMDLKGKAIGPYAGNGREDIVDGALIPSAPYALGSSSFAQPSGLTSDGKSLYVADSEGSSIRTVPLSGAGQAATLVGTSKLDKNRLFVFGNTDGAASTALLQHPLGVAYAAGRVYVADTYNNSVREIDLVQDTVRTLLGKGTSTAAKELEPLNQPSGLSMAGDQLFIADTNNHRILVFNIKESELREFVIEGLEPPAPPKPAQVVKLPSGVVEQTLGEIQVAAGQAELELPIQFLLPEGWKLNPDAPLGYAAIWKDADGKELSESSVKGKFKEVASLVSLKLSIPQTLPNSKLKLHLGLTYYFCRADGEGLCLADAAVFAGEVTLGQATTIPVVQVNVEAR